MDIESLPGNFIDASDEDVCMYIVSLPTYLPMCHTHTYIPTYLQMLTPYGSIIGFCSYLPTYLQMSLLTPTTGLSMASNASSNNGPSSSCMHRSSPRSVSIHTGIGGQPKEMLIPMSPSSHGGGGGGGGGEGVQPSQEGEGEEEAAGGAGAATKSHYMANFYYR